MVKQSKSVFLESSGSAEAVRKLRHRGVKELAWAHLSDFWLELAVCFERSSTRSPQALVPRHHPLETVIKEQSLSLWSGSTDSKPLDYQRTNPAAAAKSLQSCLTLCDPIDGSPPGSAVPGIFQARKLEWVVISFSRTNPREYQIVKTHTKEITWIQDLASPKHQEHPVQDASSKQQTK